MFLDYSVIKLEITNRNITEKSQNIIKLKNKFLNDIFSKEEPREMVKTLKSK